MKPVFIGSALLLLLISALVSVWGAYDATLTFPALLTLLISLGLFFVIVSVPISPWRISQGLIIAASLIALYFIGQYAHFEYVTETGRLARLGQATGAFLPNLIFFTPQPNAVATFLEGAFFLGLVVIWQARGLERISWGAAVAAICYGLLISSSRGAWLGLTIALGLWGILLVSNRIFRLSLISFMVISGGIGLLILSTTTPSEQPVPILSSLLETFHSRRILYQNSLYLLGDYPFTGIGLGDTFPMVYSRYQLMIQVPFLYYSHNLFIAIGLRQGILGLIAMILLLVQLYYFIMRVETVGLDKPLQSLFRAAWFGVTATLIHGMFDAAQFSNDHWTMLMLFALLGLTIKIGRPALISSQKDSSKLIVAGTMIRPRYRQTTTVAAIGLIGAFIVFWQPLVSSWYANLGSIYQTRAELSSTLDDDQRQIILASAVGHFEHVLRLNPSHPVANRRLGMIALDHFHFDMATTYLEPAYSKQPKNQATLKALGYAYLWTGQVSRAREYLAQLDDQNNLVTELDTWSWWWGTQNRTDLSNYASEMVRLLSPES